MRRSRARTGFALLLLLVLPAIAATQANEDPIAVRQRELRDLKRQMDENRGKIEELRKKEKNLGALNERLQRDKDLTARYLSRLGEQERALLSDLSSGQEELDRRSAEHDRMAETLRRRLRAYQRARHPQTAELLLSSRSFADLFARGAVLARAIQRDRTDLIWMRQQRDDLALATSLLESRRRGLEVLQEEKIREKGRIEQRSEQAVQQIAQVREERAAFERRQKELGKAEEQIRTLLARLEEARRKPPKGGKTPQPSGPGIGGRRGDLPWPATGELVGRFGVELHPRFGTKVPSNGIDIAAPTGTPIKAIAPGVAEFVDWLPGYGRCVILNHGGGFYSLYAHCSRVLVASGEKVSEGQKIAEVGDTDSVKGSCLHFEIRQGQDAKNPEEWLK
jgi:murein hydrolase activator